MPSHFDAHGPATVTGQTISFPAVSTSLTMTAGQAYTFIIYATYGAPAGPTTPRIYITNFVQNQSGDAIGIFNSDGSPASPAQIFATPELTAIAVDAGGKIYVTHQIDTLNDTLTTYNPDGSPATPTISGLHDPKGVAVDASGKIYIVNGKPTGSLTTYDRNGAQTTPTIATGLSQPVAVAIDRNGKLYVLLDNCCGSDYPIERRVATYLPNGTPTTPTIDLPPDSEYVGITVDAAGKIYVAHSNWGSGLSHTIVSTYKPDGSPTTPTITATTNTSTSTSAIAVDAAGKIYVTSLGGPITTYTPDGVPTVPSISVGVSAPTGIAVH